MNRSIKIAVLLLGVLIFSGQAYAQKKLQRGKIQYEMKLPEMKDNPFASMLGNIDLAYFFDQKTQRVDISMMGMMSMKAIQPLGKGPESGIVLLDLMGQKYQIEGMDASGMLNNQSGAGKSEEFTVNYNKKDKKTILGYKCCRADLTSGNGSKIAMYLTSKIKSSVSQSMPGIPELKGFPLQIIITSPDGKANTITATEIASAISSDVFQPGNGYKKTTMEELEKELGGLMDLGK